MWDQAEANPEMRGMGTTLVALALVDDGALAVINVGDSRLYRFHDDTLEQITLRPQPGGGAGGRGPALQGGGRVPPPAQHHDPGPGRRPRGAGGPVSAGSPAWRSVPACAATACPASCATTTSPPFCAGWRIPDEAARELVDEAKRRGGNDNITVVVVDAVDPADCPP